MEELGWRGVALPLLQRRLAPLWASLILGVFWRLWHLPSFFLSGTRQSSWSLAPYILGVLALPVILTPTFNAASGSLIIAVLFHFQTKGPSGPALNRGRNFTFALVAIMEIAINRKEMLSHGRRGHAHPFRNEAQKHAWRAPSPGSLCCASGASAQRGALGARRRSSSSPDACRNAANAE
jgi:Type II CAAX prenyl endopeptidase Rce1-like